MEDIEYLEEYEDFILPSDNNCTSRLSANRVSMDSLDGIYKELIDDPALALSEEPAMSQFIAKPNTSADITSPISKLSVDVLQKPPSSPKSNTLPATPTYLSTITTIEPPKTPAYKLSTFNRNNSSVLQRLDKLKSVATVKPTLQRISNPTKQSMQNSSPPLKSNTMGQLFQSLPLVSSTAQTVVASVAKNNAQQSKTVNAIVNPFHGPGVDPLSIDDDGFLSFDVDKHGLVDDFDFDSDLDNSIIGGISDLDSVDFSDEFSEGNFDLDSYMSSESSDGKKRVKKKKLQDTKNLKNKPAASTAKQEQTKDEMSSSQNKRIQHQPSQIIAADKRTDQQPPVGSNKKDISINSSTSRPNQPVSNDKMPKLQPLPLNNAIEKISPSANTTAVVTNVTVTATNDTDDPGSSISKDDLHFLDPDYIPSVKRDNDKTYVNKKRLSNIEDTTKTNEPSSDTAMKKVAFASEPSSLKSPQHSTEYGNNRGAATPDKNVRIKFGSMCLKSIKPPVDLIIKKIPDKEVPTASPQMPQIDAPIASPQLEPTVKEVPEKDVKRIPHDAQPATDVVAKSSPIEAIVSQHPDLVVRKITHKDASTVPQNRDLIVKEVLQSDVPMFPQFPDLIVKKIPRKDASTVAQQSVSVATKTTEKKMPTIAEQIRNLVGASQTATKLLETKEMCERNALKDTISELNSSLPCAKNKTTFVDDSKSDQSNTPNKDSPTQKSTPEGKSKELESSEKLTSQSAKPLKGSTGESGSKQLLSAVPNQSDVAKDSERVVFSTVALPQKRLERFTKGNHRWKENIKKIQQKESTIDKKKTSPLPYKFQPRSFNIRLNKNDIEKYLRSSKVPVKSKASTELMAQQQTTESKSKRLQHITPKAPILVAVNHITRTGRVEKIGLKELKGSEQPTKIVEERRETEITESATETVRHTSRKRKKTLKANGKAKKMRRSVKSSCETSYTTKDDISNNQPVVPESNVANKEPIVEQMVEVDVISSAKPTVRPNVASTETEQMETRHRRPNARTTIIESNVGSTGSSVQQLPPTDVISSAEPTVRQNAERTETEQVETPHRKPNDGSNIKESTVESTERAVEQLPPADETCSAKPADSTNVAKGGIGQLEIRTRRLKARANVNVSNVGNKEQSSSNEVKSPAQVATNEVEHKETRQRRFNLRTVADKCKPAADQSPSTNAIRPVRLSDRHKEDSSRVRSRRRSSLSSSSTDLNSAASGRPMTRRTLKEKLASENKSKKDRQLKSISPRPPVAVAPKVVLSFNRKPDTVPPEPTPPTPPPLANEVSLCENMASASTSRTESVIDPELDCVRPKTEYTGDTVTVQHNQQQSPNSTFDVRPNNTSSNNPSDTQVTVFELPSFIVMKTKIITRRDLRSGKAYIPPLVKQKFNKLAEERNVRPVLKTERADFNDVCTEINALLDRNANYLNFATVAERQTRMNQVLADSSLSVEDAQCALKFLRSYLLPPSTKEGRAKSKSHQYVPIYDSQRKIIGYRKRISKAKRSIDSTNMPVSQMISNLSTPTSTAVKTVASNRTPNVPTPCETEVVQRVIQFTTKKEPQVMEGNGNEEIITPDAPPASEQRIKTEVDSILG